MIKVSVIIPCYNQGEYLKEAIDGVLAESRPTREVIVVNDGSVDQTAETAAAYGDRIVYVEQENRGASAARNIGMRMARGEYIAFLDADDVSVPSRISIQAAYLDRHPEVGLVCSEVMLLTGPGRLRRRPRFRRRPRTPGDFRLKPLDWNPVPSTVMIRKSCVEEVGYFDETLRQGAEDWLYHIRLSRWFKAAYIDEPLVYYRTHNVSATSFSDKIGTGLRQALLILMKDPAFPGLPSLFRAELLLYAFLLFMKKPMGGRREAVPYLWSALRTNPACVGFGLKALALSVEGSMRRWIRSCRVPGEG